MPRLRRRNRERPRPTTTIPTVPRIDNAWVRQAREVDHQAEAERRARAILNAQLLTRRLTNEECDEIFRREVAHYHELVAERQRQLREQQARVRPYRVVVSDIHTGSMDEALRQVEAQPQLLDTIVELRADGGIRVIREPPRPDTLPEPERIPIWNTGRDGRRMDWTQEGAVPEDGERPPMPEPAPENEPAEPNINPDAVAAAMNRLEEASTRMRLGITDADMPAYFTRQARERARTAAARNGRLYTFGTTEAVLRSFTDGLDPHHFFHEQRGLLLVISIIVSRRNDRITIDGEIVYQHPSITRGRSEWHPIGDYDDPSYVYVRQSTFSRFVIASGPSPNISRNGLTIKNVDCVANTFRAIYSSRDAVANILQKTAGCVMRINTEGQTVGDDMFSNCRQIRRF